MNKNKEFLDQIQTLRTEHPDAEIIILVNSEEVCDESFSSQEIQSVEFDEVYNTDEQIHIGEDEILEHIVEHELVDYELAKELEIPENSVTNELMEAKAAKVLDVYRASGKVKDTIIVKAGA